MSIRILSLKEVYSISLILFLVLMVTTTPYAIAVSWSDYEIRLTTYKDFDGIPSVMETKDRKIWLFWTKSVKGNYIIVYSTSLDEGDTWSPETSLIADFSINTGVSAFQASDGTIWVVWSSDRTGNYEIFYKTSSDLGASWSDDTQLTNHSSNDLKPSIAQMSDGTIWVVWSSDRNSSGNYDLYFKTSVDNGTSWSDAFRLTTDSRLDKSPSIAQMSDGTIWVVWSSDRTGNYEIFYKTYNGSVWSNATLLLSDSKIDTNPCIFQTIDDTIWIFWSSREPSETANNDIYYMYSSDNGLTWSKRVQFTTDKYDDMWPAAIQSSQTRIWVVWTSDRADQPDGNWDIYFRTSLVGDVNEDGVVDIFDLSIVGKAYGSLKGEPEYTPEADINKDQIVDMRDIQLVARNYGAT